MKPEQKQRLAELEESLADQMISDIDPKNWPGYGKTLAEMDKETRGDALWARKVAVQGLMVLQKVQVLIVNPGAAAGKNNPTESDVDKLTAAAEREAAKLLDEVQKKGKGKTHARSTTH